MARAEILRPHELDKMRASCRLAAQTLLHVAPHVRPGVTTGELDRICHDFIVAAGAYPSPLNYRGFPRSICTSINACVCHGIPDDTALKDGDIVNVDVTTYLPAKRGYHGDTSVTFYVGEPSPAAKHVVEVAREALEIGIAAVKPGGRLGDVGHAIQSFVERKGCSVVRDYTGHGIGREFHTEPSVRHFGHPGEGPRIRRGMTFTIEPMVNLGDHPVDLLSDGWTVMTSDRSLSAQFEHTILVTRDGVEVLTARDALVPNSEDVEWARLGPLAVPASAG